MLVTGLRDEESNLRPNSGAKERRRIQQKAETRGEWKKARERNRGAERPNTDDALSASVTPRVSFICGGGSGYKPEFSSGKDFSLGLYPEVSSQVLVETVPQAICNLGGPSSLETAFRHGASKSETLVELNLQPDDSFVHPVPVEVVANDVSVVANDVSLSNLLKKASILRETRSHLQIKHFEVISGYSLHQYSVAKALLKVIAGPPQYLYLALKNADRNPASIVPTVVNDETGEKRRMNNRMRWKGYGPATIAFLDPTAPGKPPTNVEAVREEVDKNILNKLDEPLAMHWSNWAITLGKILRDVWSVGHFRELARDVLPNFGLAKEAPGSYPVYANS
ncbi:MAG: hypothetical protein NXY57DRAFT_1044605, partial [Lentinula lateritia]